MFKSLVFAAVSTYANASGSLVFDYSESGENWGHHYELCETGKEQSPIDLTNPSTSTVIKIQLD